jgi:hypothetical protein
VRIAGASAGRPLILPTDACLRRVRLHASRARVELRVQIGWAIRCPRQPKTDALTDPLGTELRVRRLKWSLIGPTYPIRHGLTRVPMVLLLMRAKTGKLARRRGWIGKMSAKSKSATIFQSGGRGGDKTSVGPTVTSSGHMVWSVRDILTSPARVEATKGMRGEPLPPSPREKRSR